MSSTDKDQVQELLSKLKRERDELRLQIHLGKEELKDEWDKLESKLANLDDQYQPVKDAVEETASEIWASMKLVGGEILEGFHRIRKSL